MHTLYKLTFELSNNNNNYYILLIPLGKLGLDSRQTVHIDATTGFQCLVQDI